MLASRGYILVASLLLMALLLILGTGASLLSFSNVSVSRNVRTNAVTRYRAEAGLDAALASLDSRVSGVFPVVFPVSSITLPIEVDTSSAQPNRMDLGSTGDAIYTRFDDENARISVTARDPALEAEYTATAVVTLAGEQFGIFSNESVRSGDAASTYNATIYSGNELIANATLTDAQRITAAPSATCGGAEATDDSWAGYCSSTGSVIDTSTVAPFSVPSFATLIDATLLSLPGGAPSGYNEGSGDLTTIPETTALASTTIDDIKNGNNYTASGGTYRGCVPPGFTGGSVGAPTVVVVDTLSVAFAADPTCGNATADGTLLLENITIVVRDGALDFNKGSVTLDNVTLVMGDGFTFDNVASPPTEFIVNDSSILANGDVSIYSRVTVEGDSTIAALNDIKFLGTTTLTDAAGVAIISGNKIELKGGDIGGGAFLTGPAGIKADDDFTTINAIFMAEGPVDFNGKHVDFVAQPYIPTTPNLLTDLISNSIIVGTDMRVIARN